MAQEKRSITRKLAHAGGWHIVKRGAKMLPFGGTAVVLALVGHDIKKKGLARGLMNSGFDAIPFVGLAKNGIEIFAGDFFPDKPQNNKGK